MDTKLINEKFGDNYSADESTFIMGIDKKITSKVAERFKDRNVLETCTGGGIGKIRVRLRL